MKKTLIFSLFLSLLLLSTANIQAQSPADILDRMIQEQTNSLSGIETMMVVTKLDGFISSETPDTTYYRKVTMNDGTQTLEAISSVHDTPNPDYFNFKHNYDLIVENSVYEGTQNVNGRTAHVILIEDISSLYGNLAAGAVPGTSVAQSGRLFVDSRDNVLLMMQFDMQFDEQYFGSIDLIMSDYRNVDGLRYPFVMEMQIEGISEMFSAEDLAKARQGLAELNNQIENASRLERRILERAVRPQVERFERMLEDAGMMMRMETLAIETNVEIPD